MSVNTPSAEPSSVKNSTEQNATLLQYLKLEQIKTCSPVASKKKLLECVAELLGGGDHATNKKVFQAIVERERLGSTGIGDGIALPHGRCDEISQARLCIITLDKAVDYDANDNLPVSIAFGLIVPSDANKQHLQLLATIAELMSSKTVHQHLLACNTPSDIMTYIQSQAT